MVSKELKSLYKKLPGIEKELRQMRDIILANLVMIGEIPAPTFEEERRIEFLMNRFTEAGVSECSTDEAGNGIGILNGSVGKKSILINAHADTVFSGKIDHTMLVEKESVTGPGTADNSLGLALLASLPYILERLDIKLNDNLILLGGVKSLGRGDLQGIRFFLENNEFNITSAICLEGVELGRVSYSSIGMLRGEIRCRVPETYDWTRFGEASAIMTLNEVINKINDIRMPKRPRTSIVMGSIEGGTSFNTTALEATLHFEVRSESAEVVEQVGQRIQEIGIEVSSKAGDEVDVDIFAHRMPGGIPFGHPLNRVSIGIMEKLGIEHRIAPSISELSALIRTGIPALTLGLTTGDNLHKSNESVQIEPIYKGITQILGILLAIDGGHCD